MQGGGFENDTEARLSPEAGHTLTQPQVPSTSSEEKFPSVFLSFGSTHMHHFSLFSDESVAQGQG